MEKRTMLAVVLSMIVIMGYYLVFQKPTAKSYNNSTSVTVAGKTNASLAPKVAVGSATASPAGPSKGEQKPSEKKIAVDTPLYTATFSTRGASLQSLRLKGYSTGAANKGNSVEMISTKAATHLPLAVSFVESSIDMPQDVSFAVAADTLVLGKDDREGKKLVFTTTHGRIRVEKSYRFLPDSYAIEMDLRVTNLAAMSVTQNPILFWYSDDVLSGKSDATEKVGPVYYLVKEVKRPAAEDFASGKQDGPDVAWAGFESKYFLAAMIPSHPLLASISLGKDLTNTTYVSLFGGKLLIAPGETANSKFSLFIGPKEYGALSAQNATLERAIDFGFFKWIAVPILLFMKFLYAYIPNYGVGIIVLAFLIKLLFWPLGNISYRSMKKMQDLQPRLKELQEKYKNDRQKLGQETMALYKQHKVNPMSGCLPVVVQIPVFIALFNTLGNAIELRHAHFCLWLTDLSAADPYYITPILMGATMFIQQKMSPPPADPMQAKIMLFLPLVFTVFFLNFSSGLVLYWLISNVLSIGQQFYVNKKLS